MKMLVGTVATAAAVVWTGVIHSPETWRRDQLRRPVA
jgi:hypothetical protein